MQVYFYFSAYNHHTATPPGLLMLRSLLLILKIILIFISRLPVFSLGVIIPKQFHVSSGWKTAKDFQMFLGFLRGPLSRMLLIKNRLIDDLWLWREQKLRLHSSQISNELFLSVSAACTCTTCFPVWKRAAWRPTELPLFRTSIWPCWPR